MKKIIARQLTLKIFMLWAKKNSYKEFDNEKKFLRFENPPPPPVTFLMVRPLANVIFIYLFIHLLFSYLMTDRVSRGF